MTLAQYLAQNRKVDAALEQLDAALKASPNNAGVLELKARIQIAARDWAGATTTAKAIVQALPKQALGYYLEGVAQQGKGDLAAAATLLEQAVERAPKAVEPVTALVQTLLLAKQPDKALTRLDRLIAEQPESALAWNLKGEVLLSQKKGAEAEVALKKAVELAPKSAVLYRNLALADLLAGDAEGALKAFREGVDATGGQPVLRFQLASLYEQLGRYDEAIAEHEAMLKANPDSPAVANNLAMLLVSYRTDAASLSRARELAARLEGSDNAAFLDTLGWVQYRQGELDAALANLKKAVEKSPEAAIMQYHLGMVYFAKGDQARAKEHLQKAVTGDTRYPGVEEARATLAKLK
jgi:predicted Zn-dependent protease